MTKRFEFRPFVLTPVIRSPGFDEPTSYLCNKLHRFENGEASVTPWDDDRIVIVACKPPGDAVLDIKFRYVLFVVLDELVGNPSLKPVVVFLARVSEHDLSRCYESRIGPLTVELLTEYR